MKDTGLLVDRPREATTPPEMRGLARDGVRLLVSTGRGHEHARFRDIGSLLPHGALLVVNRSATLPASLPATGRLGAFRLNLSTQYGPRIWLAEPRWDHRAPGPLPVTPGESFEAGGIVARFLSAYPSLPRLWFVSFEAYVELAMAMEGEPVRYGYLEPPYPPIAAYQTIFGSVLGSAEMPSAARPFTKRVLDDLAARGIATAPIELHAGVSSLDLDPTDPVMYPEPFEVPTETANAVNAARAANRPVIAVGTTVVRALESAWDGEKVRAVRGFTRLFVDARRGVHAVDGLLTGFHDLEASHLAMLHAVAGEGLVADAYAEAIREGYLWHEFGDSHLLLPAGGMTTDAHPR